MRGMMITVEGEDYMSLARAKGLGPFYMLYRYMVRNAILPQITAFAITLGTLVSGQILGLNMPSHTKAWYGNL